MLNKEQIAREQELNFFLTNAVLQKNAMHGAERDALQSLTKYFKNILQAQSLDGEVHRGKERTAGVLEVADGSVTFVKKLPNGMNREMLYRGKDWLHYEGYTKPRDFVGRLTTEFSPTGKVDDYDTIF